MGIELRHWGGAMSRPDENAGPIGHRQVPFTIVAGGQAETPEDAERMMAGAKITDTIARTRSNTAMMRIASATGENPLPVVMPGAARRTPATHAGAAGLPIVSA